MLDEKIDKAARAERLEYFRQWRAANKDKVKQHNENYWKKRAEKRLKEEQVNQGEVAKNANN